MSFTQALLYLMLGTPDQKMVVRERIHAFCERNLICEGCETCGGLRGQHTDDCERKPE